MSSLTLHPSRWILRLFMAQSFLAALAVALLPLEILLKISLIALLLCSCWAYSWRKLIRNPRRISILTLPNALSPSLFQLERQDGTSFSSPLCGPIVFGPGLLFLRFQEQGLIVARDQLETAADYHALCYTLRLYRFT